MSDRGLPLPVGQALENAVSERTQAEVWRRIQAERAVRPARRRLYLTGAVAALGTAAGVLVLYATTTPNATEIAGPIRLTNGGAPVVVAVEPAATPQTLLFDDQSKVVLNPGSRLEPVTNTSTAFAVRLVEGRARFDVTPGGAREWSIDCGVAIVEVVGTSFTITRESDSVRVEVTRGTVRVRSSSLAGGLATLHAGDNVAVAAMPDPGKVAQAAPSPGSVPAPVPVPVPESVSVSVAESDPVSTPSPESAPVRDLWRRADEARAAGQTEVAIGLLETITRDHATDRSASLAAFTAGRLAMDAVRNPARAAALFERALELGAPNALAQLAYGRLVNAHIAAGRADEARRAAARSVERFPEGRNAAQHRALLSAP